MSDPKIFTQMGNEIIINDLISRLRFLSKVNHGEKLNVKHFFVRDNRDIFQRILRTFKRSENCENKDSTIKFVTELTDQTLTLIDFYMQDKKRFSQNLANTLRQNLKDAMSGIESLIVTYKDDRIFSSKLEAVLTTTGIRLKELE